MASEEARTRGLTSKLFHYAVHVNGNQGNLDERCNDPLIWELMLQAGPICASRSTLQQLGCCRKGI